MFFILSFLFFSSIKLENRRAKQVLPRREGWQQWEPRWWGKGVGG
jgi:hypothetical protein